MKKFIVLDIICYVVLPYFIWNYGREPIGDYWSILLSTVPGFVYTIYRFSKERELNITGLSVILVLLLSTMVNLLSKNAESMLWNQVYFGYAYGFVFLISILLRKPLALVFAVDFVYLQGFARKDSKTLFSKKPLFFWFQLLTVLMFVNSLFQNSFKAWLLSSYGVDGYGHMLIYLKVSGWIFSGLIIAGFFFVGHKVNVQIEKDSIAPVALLPHETGK